MAQKISRPVPNRLSLLVSNHKILVGESLFAALSNIPAHMIKLVREGQLPRPIEPAEALAIARAGCYEGKLQGGKLRLIREVDTRRKVETDVCRWDDRAVMHYATSVCRETVDIWDRILCAE